MIYLTKAVFINSCQTFIFFPLLELTELIWGCAVSPLSLVLSRGGRRCTGGFVIYAPSLVQVTQDPPIPPPAPDILKTKKKQTENKSLTSLDASAWCVVNTENLIRLRHCRIWSVYSVFFSKMALMLPITPARKTGRRGGAFLHQWFWCHLVPLHRTSASTYCAGVLQLAGRSHEWTQQRMGTKCGYTHVHPGACEMTLNPFSGWKVKSDCRKKIIYSLKMKKREKICSEWLDAMCTYKRRKIKTVKD